MRTCTSTDLVRESGRRGSSTSVRSPMMKLDADEKELAESVSSSKDVEAI
jgi:hypothetical protein